MRVLILRGERHRAPNGRHGDSGVIAFGSAGQWLLVNVSAPVAQRLDAGNLPAGLPGLADPSVRAIVLTDPQLEHVGGLLALRRGAPIDLYVTPAVFEELSIHLPVLPALQHYCGVHWRVVPVAGDCREATFRIDGLPTLEFTALATQAPPWPHVQQQRAVVGDSIALVVTDTETGVSVFCAPGLAHPGPQEIEWMRRCDCVLLDDPRPRPGRMPAWVEWVDALPARHKVMLADTDAPQADRLARLGVAVAADGMEIEL